MVTIFNLAQEADRDSFNKLLKNKSVEVFDQYEAQLKELFSISNPTFVFNHKLEEEFFLYLKKIKKTSSLKEQGRWVYFPWRNSITHLLEEDDFQMVRTSRNKNLITDKEQKKFYNSTIGIAGLSVGNSVAVAIALQGGGKNLKLADNDVLDLSNSNRLITSVSNLGAKKVELTAQQIYEINPYTSIKLFSDGITDDNIVQFFEGLDLAIDEVDNLSVKLKIRNYAKVRRVPVLMGTDNGEGVIIDVDRYDLNKENESLIMTLKNNPSGETSKIEMNKMIINFLGRENIHHKMMASLDSVGKDLISWPQLGSAAAINGAILASLSRLMLNGHDFKKSRITLKLEDYFNLQ